jgi:hypothetical protein
MKRIKEAWGIFHITLYWLSSIFPLSRSSWLWVCDRHLNNFSTSSPVDGWLWAQQCCAHLTLQDWDSLLSFWNQDCWAQRVSAPVTTLSLSRSKPMNTDRTWSRSLALNSRTKEFWEQRHPEDESLCVCVGVCVCVYMHVCQCVTHHTWMPQI